LAFRGDPRSREGETQLWSFAEELLPRRDVGSFNQALMELGSLICKPRAPSCDECPVAMLCPTRAQGLQNEIPPPARKPTIETVRAAAAIIRRNHEVLLVRNPEGERWAGLWDFPRFEFDGEEKSPAAVQLAKLVAERTGLNVRIERPLTTLKHGVTRFRITLDAWLGEPIGGRLRRGPWSPRWIKIAAIDELPLSVTGRKLAKVLSAER
jgi:A/G-specific adenine glycosylase